MLGCDATDLICRVTDRPWPWLPSSVGGRGVDNGTVSARNLLVIVLARMCYLKVSRENINVFGASFEDMPQAVT